MTRHWNRRRYVDEYVRAYHDLYAVARRWLAIELCIALATGVHPAVYRAATALRRDAVAGRLQEGTNPVINAEQVQLVRVGDHRIDAVVSTYDPYAQVLNKRLAAWSVRDAFGWAVMARSVLTGEIRTISRVNHLPDFAARPVVAGRLVVAATVA